MKYIIFAVLMAAATAAYVETYPEATYPATSIETPSSEVGYSEPTEEQHYNVDVEDDDDDDEEVKDQIDTLYNDIVPVYETVSIAPTVYVTDSAPVYKNHVAPTAVYHPHKTVLPYWLRPKTQNY